MKRSFVKQIIFLSVLTVSFFASCGKPEKGTVVSVDYRRIISFAPSITETLFALGLGDRVVGVTRFCTYPPQAVSLPKIGGYLDPNYEMILSLKPDMVLMLKEHSTLKEFLNKNKIRYIAIDNESVGAILSSFKTIGTLCNAVSRADSIVKTIEGEISGSSGQDQIPTVLFCVGRDNPGAGSVAKVYIAGPRTFYSELIVMAGGRNVYTDSLAAYPALSGEGIARLMPDIIIDVMASTVNVAPEKVTADWNCLPMVPAVKNGRVYSLSGDYVTIPGPRIGLVLKDLKAIMKGDGAFAGKGDAPL